MKNKGMYKAIAILTFAVIVAGVFSFLKRPAASLKIIGEDTSNLSAMIDINPKIQDQLNTSIQYTAASYEDLVKRAGEDLASKSGIYDVILEYPLSISSYARNNWILPVLDYPGLGNSAILETNLFQNVWREIGFFGLKKGEETAYGFPFAANTIFLCYNRKLFEDPQQQADFKSKYSRDLAPPKTWKSYVEIAEFFTQPRIGINGVTMLGQEYWIAWEWANFAFSHGGGVMKKQYGWQTPPSADLLLLTDETREATKIWAGLKPFNAGNNFLGTGMVEQLEEMRQGAVAMCLLWSDQAFNLLNGPGGVNYDSHFGFAPIPGNVSMIAGGTFMLNASSGRQEQGAEYIETMLKPSTQVELARKGLCSPVRTTYSDPEVMKIPYSEALRESLERGVYMLDAGPDSDLIFVTLSKYLREIWTESISVEDALTRAHNEIKSGREDLLNN